MAVLPPITGLLDSLHIADQRFQLMRRDEYSRTAGGSIISRQIGGPIWSATWSTAPMRHEQIAAFEADLDALDGSLRFFYAGDMRRPVPIAMQGIPFTDGGLITATQEGRFIDASGIDPDLVLTKGDYVSFNYGAKPYRFLARVMNATKAPNAGGILNGLEIRPHLPPVSVIGSTMQFNKPEALFVLNGADAIKQQTTNGAFTTISIEAVQAF